MTEKKTCGSRAQVWHGNAKKTCGGLTKSNLMKNKHGRIASKRKHNLGKKSIKNLRRLGYVAKKGRFKLFSKTRGTRKRGGNDPANPATTFDQLFGQDAPKTGGDIGSNLFGQ
jgi:hypothetical protein